MSSSHHYPAALTITPFTGTLNVTVDVPGSKSLTNRAMVLAAMSPRCTLTGALQSEDTEVMIDCLRRLGWQVTEAWGKQEVTVERIDANHDSKIPKTNAELFVGNSGTTIRFLTAMLALGNGHYRLDGIPRMRERPIGDLLDGLTQLGVNARSEADTGCPPVVLEAHGLKGGRVSVRADKSSQFLSGLLLALPFAEADTEVTITGPLVSEPYIAMTLSLLRQCGLSVEVQDGGRTYRVPGRQTFIGGSIAIEPDASSASYWFAAAAITGGRVTVSNLTRESLQGDVAFVDCLEKMGCRVEVCDQGITIHGRPLHGIDVDMNAISDTVMTLGVIAVFATGPTTIRNVGHIRHKETDRLSALATELRRLGIGVEETEDSITINPGPVRPAAVETYNDHRMAMSLALAGLKSPGVTVKNPGCVVKTYPGFWNDFDRWLSPTVPT
ncbi:3-phosphoshikimate 1-carboxyvinyltransferase [Zavarzinella formosa]|uniref:3-phosphoshikimate 1-carboxyvinyltransferase n=1 Tax=Zavarzinella formosa TaxID=360055 RepID=UPI0002D2CA3C|nr:3-phosphoshikimate 1-carboxyvinyltransferase [Zavarzinella formosa]